MFPRGVPNDPAVSWLPFLPRTYPSLPSFAKRSRDQGTETNVIYPSLRRGIKQLLTVEALVNIGIIWSISHQIRIGHYWYSVVDITDIISNASILNICCIFTRLDVLMSLGKSVYLQIFIKS